MTMTSLWRCPVSLGWALPLAGCGSAQMPPVLPSPVLPSTPEDACNAGDAKGCFELGLRFEDGRGVGQDKARAAALYTKACDAGEAYSCFSLGVLLLESRGVGKGKAGAAAAFARGCALGDQESCAKARK